MKEFFNYFKPAGKTLTIFSLILLIGSIVSSFFLGWEFLICGLLIDATLDYLTIQYFTTEEGFQKLFQNKINKKSRNYFALFFTITTIILCLGIFKVINSSLTLYLTAAGLLAQSIACVFNEYGINGEKKKKGIIACIVVFFALILFIYLAKTQLGF